MAAGAAPPPDDGEHRRLKILDRAARALLTHGYDGANLEDIAIAAGVSKVTIYRFFSSKNDLLRAVVRQAAAGMIAGCRGALRSDLAPENALTGFAERYIAGMLAPVAAGRPFYEISRLLISMSLRDPELARSFTEMYQPDITLPLTDYLAAAAERGEIDTDDPDFLAKHFIQALFFTNAALLAPGDGFSSEQIRDLASRKVGLFLRGCARRSPPVFPPMSPHGAA